MREALAGDEELAQFKAELKNSPTSVARVASPSAGPAIPGVLASSRGVDTAKPAAPPVDPLKEFFAWAPEYVVAAQKLIEKNRQTEVPGRQLHDTLVELQEKITELKQRSGLPELRPAWQVATALEGLLMQLARRADNINQSTLRTISGALDLLAELCVAGVRPDIAADPAIRILGVDDDPVTRFALSNAVKKSFDLPDMADSGPAALEKIEQGRYDLIILDVMMPDMDGFEVCNRIRQTSANGSTPVLFVTALKDFDSRSRLLTMSGTDVMGKPFITFEITVKVLTLALRGRLRSVSSAPVSTGPQAVRWTAPSPAAEEKPAAPLEGPVVIDDGGAKANQNTGSLVPPAPFVASEGKNTFNPEFPKFMDATVEDLKRQIGLIVGSEADSVRVERITRLHMRMEALSRALNVPELRPAFDLCSAVEGMCLKLKNDPRAVTPSALRTAGSALEVIKELCAPGIKADLGEKPPIRIMVVDDEPLARRALVSALQMKLPRPDGVESPQSALLMAGEKAFDLVFLDVCMPEMDGFTVCAKLHETATNKTTPVVFVTSHSDADFRMQARQCGGKDYVVKPFDFIEIPVKALAYVLQSRLEKSKSTESPVAAPSP